MIEGTGITIAAGIAGLIIGFAFGRLYPKNEGIYQFFHRTYTNLDNLMMAISAIMVAGSICFAVDGHGEKFATITINAFSSIIFSWLLTKKSAREEFMRQQEELALRSYRHINYIEMAANTAYKKLEKYSLEDGELDVKSKLILSSAMDQIKYIQGGINTCKLDWYDMLSVSEKEHYKGSSEVSDKDYGTVDVADLTSNYNQEEA